MSNVIDVEQRVVGQLEEEFKDRSEKLGILDAPKMMKVIKSIQLAQFIKAQRSGCPEKFPGIQWYSVERLTDSLRERMLD